jgi:hypothetical protein
MAKQEPSKKAAPKTGGTKTAPKKTVSASRNQPSPVYKPTWEKATRDSSDYYNDKADDLVEAWKNTGNEKFKKEAGKAYKSAIRQELKGKPGFTGNGFPIKKRGGTIKTKTKK